MFSMNASRPGLRPVATLALCAAAAAYGLTSNQVQALAGAGDTLWLATATGVDFAIDTTDTTPQWWSQEAAEPWALAFGEGRALACVAVDNQRTVSTSTFFTFDHRSRAPATVTLAFQHPSYASLADTLIPQLVCYSAARGPGAWWLAYYEGGLVRWDSAGGPATAFVPGVPRAAAQSTAFPTAAVRDSLRTPRTRAVFVAADRSGGDTVTLWVATPARIWRFSPADTTWDTLANAFDDPGLSLVEHIAVYADQATRPARLYGVSAVRRSGRDTVNCLFKYESGEWVYVFGKDAGQSAVRGAAFAPGGYVYAADSTGLSLYVDTAAGPPVRIADPAHFRARMMAATQDVAWEVMRVNDVLATVESDSTIQLWIATSEGLFYARGERPGALVTTPFKFTKRSPPVKAGLAQTYAYPGILNESLADRRVYFAYNLSEAARVTIRIYDWNMDLVKVAVNNERREAGKNRESQRSSDRARDWWDGTNQTGRTVAPGVYYYRITTDKGGRAFGKIVVALSR